MASIASMALPSSARIARPSSTAAACLVVDLDVVRDNYNAFAKALPDTRVFYAVKANPAPEVLALLAKLGSCFDTASIFEIELVLAAGATPDRVSYGNTIKKERDIARAYALGVRLYAVDCKAEVEKVARAAPGSRVFCRILSDCVGAEWPLSRKFGCEPAMLVIRNFPSGLIVIPRCEPFHSSRSGWAPVLGNQSVAPL